MKRFSIVALTLFGLASVAIAVQRGGWRGGYRSSDDRNGVPVWESNDKFPHDVFTFARVRYYSDRRGEAWKTDHPDADLNFSLRLQQLTSMKVNPYPVYLDLTDPKLFDYPFLYMIEPGGIRLSEPEAEALRRYCNNGGFMMVDDFWGEYEWRSFEMAMEQVFPNRKWEEVAARARDIPNGLSTEGEASGAIDSCLGAWWFDGRVWSRRRYRDAALSSYL